MGGSPSRGTVWSDESDPTGHTLHCRPPVPATAQRINTDHALSIGHKLGNDFKLKQNSSDEKGRSTQRVPSRAKKQGGRGPQRVPLAREGEAPAEPKRALARSPPEAELFQKGGPARRTHLRFNLQNKQIADFRWACPNGINN